MTTLQVNLKAGNAVTQYTNYLFNSIDIFQREVLMATDDGLYKQGGDLDDTTIIKSYFELIKTDFGRSSIKRLLFIYLSYYATEDILFTVSTEQNKTQDFTIPANLSGQQGYRLRVSHELYGRFWTFKVSNLHKYGADFSIDEIKVLPLVKVHGLNYT